MWVATLSFDPFAFLKLMKLLKLDWAEKLKGDGIISLSLNPGNIRTEVRISVSLIAFVWLLTRLFLFSFLEVWEDSSNQSLYVSLIFPSLSSLSSTDTLDLLVEPHSSPRLERSDYSTLRSYFSRYHDRTNWSVPSSLGSIRYSSSTRSEGYRVL